MNEKPTIITVFVYAIFYSFQSQATDDKFIKRYAVMKMYESCFSPDVVKEIHKEMRMATAKCSANSVPVSSSYPQNSATGSKKPVAFMLHPHKQLQQQQQQQMADGLYSPEHLKTQTSSNIDLNKLQQVILAGYSKQNSVPLQPVYTNNISPPTGYSHAKPWSFFPPTVASSYSHMTGFSPGPGPSTFGSQYFSPISPLYQSVFFSPFYASGRSSKDLDFKGQLESMMARVSGKFKNVTCIMQELGYLNENLEPDYESISNRIKNLAIPNELKSDMIDGVQYCKQFSMCVPDEGKDKLSKEMARPMFFFRCYKHKKMEACIMKDIKDRYTSNEVDDNILGYRRSDRSSPEFNVSEVTELTSFEILFGDDYADFDMF